MFRLYDFRKDYNLTQKDVAIMFDCRQNNISVIESQRKDLTANQLNILIEKYGNGVKDYIATESQEVLSEGLPFYDVDVTLGFDNLPNDQTAIPSYCMNIPAFKNCDCAVPCYGRSMVPEINDGAIIAIKEINKDSVLPGEAYLIITEEYRTVKYIRTIKGNSTKWRLVPENTDEYDEMLIDIDKVLKVFLVKGVITNKIL